VIAAPGDTGGVYVSPWWQASVLPSRWDVCGIILPSLSVWHIWALENTPPGIGSPYVCGGAAPTVDDAAAVLTVAAYSRDAWLRDMQWSEKRRAKARRLVYKAIARNGAKGALAAVHEYVTCCMRTPAHDYADNAKMRAARGPWTWHIVVALSGGDPARMAAVWDMPYAMAKCTLDIMRERQPGGDDSLAGPKRQRSIDALAEWKARANAGDIP